MRLVVLVSGRGSNLRSIAQAIDEGRCAATLAAVVSDKADAPALEFARERGIPTDVVPFRKGDDRAAWNERLADTMASHSPELVVLAGFMRILGPNVIDRFAGRIVNVHPALLPSFAGLDAVGQAVAHGVRVTGVTVHFVDEGVDTGPILLQEAVELTYTRPMDEVMDEIHAVEHRLLPLAVELIAAGRVSVDAENSRLVRIEGE